MTDRHVPPVRCVSCQQAPTWGERDVCEACAAGTQIDQWECGALAIIATAVGFVLWTLGVWG